MGCGAMMRGLQATKETVRQLAAGKQPTRAKLSAVSFKAAKSTQEAPAVPRRLRGSHGQVPYKGQRTVTDQVTSPRPRQSHLRDLQRVWRCRLACEVRGAEELAM